VGEEGGEGEDWDLCLRIMRERKTGKVQGGVRQEVTT